RRGEHRKDVPPQPGGHPMHPRYDLRVLSVVVVLRAPGPDLSVLSLPVEGATPMGSLAVARGVSCRVHPPARLRDLAADLRDGSVAERRLLPDPASGVRAGNGPGPFPEIRASGNGRAVAVAERHCRGVRAVSP